MNPQDPLQQLRDIHAPDAASWWPLAWGWWLVILVVGIALLCGVWWLLRRKRRNRYRAQALQEAEVLWRHYQTEGNTLLYLEQVNRLLRRCLLHLRPRAEVARLQGDAWLKQLAAVCPECAPALREGSGRVLADGHYRPNPEADIDKLHPLILTWIREHRDA
ncbi:DUF4381 domain-containing protein [Marinimicrobium alkaliphilum]|uniref:DUF4381 domain-containing protein n=1 Tax=Marinimicrobium alkaliphilum TaxID=2202654 RepID=UPI00130082C2|nr:DUF4381 domain-containing protein [Marinimicrobium alkaliphilum]